MRKGREKWIRERRNKESEEETVSLLPIVSTLESPIQVHKLDIAGIGSVADMVIVDSMSMRPFGATAAV
jgi:hypothetical protein